MEYKYGVCICDLYITNTIKDLKIFDTYEEACSYYLEKINKSSDLTWIDSSFENYSWINPNLWIVWIRKSDNRIEQFDQLTWKTKCKLVELENDNA